MSLFDILFGSDEKRKAQALQIANDLTGVITDRIIKETTAAIALPDEDRILQLADRITAIIAGRLIEEASTQLQGVKIPPVHVSATISSIPLELTITIGEK